MSEIIQAGDDILAIIISSAKSEDGTTFFTPGHFPFQLGLMKREAGHKVEAHYHTNQTRQISSYQEFLFVRSGKIKVALYDLVNKFVADRILSTGDCVLFAAGGHGVEIIEEAEVIELKQGPFLGDDKVFIP